MLMNFSFWPEECSKYLLFITIPLDHTAKDSAIQLAAVNLQN